MMQYHFIYVSRFLVRIETHQNGAAEIGIITLHNIPCIIYCFSNFVLGI